MDLRKKFSNLVFISVTCLLAICASMPIVAFGATKPFPFEDANNNGVYDIGERDITADLETGIFETQNSIVIPAGVKGFRVNGENGIALLAGKNITVNNGYLISTNILLYAEEGTITIGDKTALTSAGFVSIDAGQDVAIGSRATIYANGDVANIYSRGGNILVEEKTTAYGGDTTLYGKDSLYLYAERGTVTVLAGTRLWSKGYVTIYGLGDLEIIGSRVDAAGAHISTEGHLIEFCNNKVQVSGKEGWVYFGAAGSTVDITGSKFRNLDPQNLIIEATDIIR